MVPYKFLKCLFYLCEVCHWYLIRVCFESMNYFGKYGHFDDVNFSNPWPWHILPFIHFFLYFFHQCCIVFWVQVFSTITSCISVITLTLNFFPFYFPLELNWNPNDWDSFVKKSIVWIYFYTHWCTMVLARFCGYSLKVYKLVWCIPCILSNSRLKPEMA